MKRLLADRVAIVTGAARGLGRTHALALARHGAKVLVNDLDAAAGESVCAEIAQLGSEALTDCADVRDAAAVEAMAAAALGRWGRVDILVNNAGILRDRTFAKLDLADFRLVLEVHLMGSVNCTRALWPHMRERRYGRVVLTTSSSGLYGNFGQTAYSAAKMALVGLMQTLALEGERYDIRVNCLAPSAATQMTDELWTPEDGATLDPRHVSPAVVALASEGAPNKCILLAGGGSFKLAHITMTQGIHVADDEQAAERILREWSAIADRSGEIVPAKGFEQHQFELATARKRGLA
jgi:NAD(P)-dependent dehydrogenase (short-subunit alcohol dehydrogenase family)